MLRGLSTIDAQSEEDESLENDDHRAHVEYDDHRAHAKRCTYVVLRIWKCSARLSVRSIDLNMRLLYSENNEKEKRQRPTTLYLKFELFIWITNGNNKQ